MALVALLSGCQSVPTANVSVSDDTVSSKSSMLAVDIVFPAPWNRERSLVQAFFVKEPADQQAAGLPELIVASFVKWDRAYLLDPQPGTYYLVAVTAAYAPPWNNYRIAGVTHTRWSGTSADAMIFPAELIQQTRTTITEGRMAFMGALRIRPGHRISREVVFEDNMQRLIAERIRPGVVFNSGLAGWLKRSWVVDLEESSFHNQVDDRDSFVDVAISDLGDSPWAQVVSREADGEVIPAAIAKTPAPVQTKTDRRAPNPNPVAPMKTATSATTRATQPATTSSKQRAPGPGPERATAIHETAPARPLFAAVAPNTSEPIAPIVMSPKPKPTPRRFPGLPVGTGLAEIEFGMSHEDVRGIMGDPDDRLNRVTAKAWIPFYDGPDAILREWIYAGKGRVIFSLYHGSLDVLDVISEPNKRDSPPLGIK